MAKISAGISQIGGKFRLVNTLLKFTPYHEFFLSPFCGACWFELNKPRCRYECFNDLESEIINYLVQIRAHPKEFDKLKRGVFGLVSQEICNRIVRGEILPKNDIERAYFFYYLNKLTFGGMVWQVRKNPPYNGITPTAQNGDVAKASYAAEKAHYGGLETYGMQVRKTDVNKAKANYRGILTPDVPRTKEIEKIKANYRGVTPKNFKSTAYKGLNPKTTRPYSNNDCGLLSPLKPIAIKRLRYVNLTCYPFQKVYKMFYDAFHVRKGLSEECFIYCDPPYVGTEKYYKSGFGEKEHYELIEIIKNCPFHILLSIGGNCQFYLDELEDLTIVPVEVRYSTDANSQKKSQEYLIMNYDINKLPLMTHESTQNTMETFL